MTPRERTVAVVTGADGGIGRAVVTELVGRGLTAVGLDSRPIEDTSWTRGAAPVRTFAVDITDGTAVREVVRTVEDDVGEIDLLVNVAGVLRETSAVTPDPEAWGDIVGVNLMGTVTMSQAVAPRLVARRRGAIVTVASNAGRVPRLGLAAYGASKAAASYYTRTLGLEVAGSGVRCNVVSPGSTDTTMLHALWHGEDRRRETIDGSLASYKLGVPLQRIATPADIAKVVAFLGSDDAAHITMQELFVDGGATLGAA